VDLSVFDGGQTNGKVRQSEAELTEVRQMARKAALGISLEVEQARLAHADAVERLAVSSRAVEQAAEGAALSHARFEKEALLTADLIGAETRLLEARLRRTAAASDERLAVVELRLALGLTPLPPP
jgi:outer membrane protein TolC